jgi:hypothetical protein
MFFDSWLPNIVCTIAGCLLSWWIGYRQGKAVVRATEMQSRKLETLMFAMRDKGLVELEIGPDGHITDGRIIQLQAVATMSSMAVANLTTGPAAP